MDRYNSQTTVATADHKPAVRSRLEADSQGLSDQFMYFVQGIGLDPVSNAVLAELGLGDKCSALSLPLQVEAYRRVDPSSEPRAAVTLVENWEHDHRSMLWSSLHKTFLQSLPRHSLFFSHEVSKIQQTGDGVAVTALHKQADGSRQEQSFIGDIIIAADGINSFVRRQLIAADKKRWAPATAPGRHP